MDKQLRFEQVDQLVAQLKDLASKAFIPVGAPTERKGPIPNQKQMACMAGLYTVDRNVRSAQEIIDALFRVPLYGGRAIRERAAVRSSQRGSRLDDYCV